jgi:hypothetical protein
MGVCGKYQRDYSSSLHPRPINLNHFLLMPLPKYELNNISCCQYKTVSLPKGNKVK